MINKLSEKLIVSFEGERLTSYKDGGGVWTIGVGHTTDQDFQVKQNQTITREKSRELLSLDLKEAEGYVKELVKVPLNENQYGALVSFVFNLGGGAFKISTLLKKLNAGNYSAVPSELNKWVNDNGRIVNGLVKRRAAEGVLWNTPVATQKPVESIPEVIVPKVPEIPEASVQPYKTPLWLRILTAIARLIWKA